MTPSRDQELETDLEMVAAVPSIPAILRLIRQQANMGLVAVARVTPTRWLACSVLDEVGIGLQAGSELDIHATPCKERLAGKGTMAFDDALADVRYREHPVPALYGISQLYLLAHPADRRVVLWLPVRHRPAAARRFDAGDGGDGRGLRRADWPAAGRSTCPPAHPHGPHGGAVAREFEGGVHRRGSADLRNPLATMHTASQLLTRSADAGAARVGTRLLQSANRMLGLINDLVDYARGRAGTAVPLKLGEHAELGAALQEVVDEVRVANPGQDIRREIDIPCPVRCEPVRLQQRLSNLLGNPIAHRAAGEPILVHASETDGTAVIRSTTVAPPFPPRSLRGCSTRTGKRRLASSKAAWGWA